MNSRWNIESRCSSNESSIQIERAADSALPSLHPPQAGLPIRGGWFILIFMFLHAFPRQSIPTKLSRTCRLSEAQEWLVKVHLYSDSNLLGNARRAGIERAVEWEREEGAALGTGRPKELPRPGMFPSIDVSSSFFSLAWTRSVSRCWRHSCPKQPPSTSSSTARRSMHRYGREREYGKMRLKPKTTVFSLQNLWTHFLKVYICHEHLRFMKSIDGWLEWHAYLNRVSDSKKKHFFRCSWANSTIRRSSGTRRCDGISLRGSPCTSPTSRADSRAMSRYGRWRGQIFHFCSLVVV